MAAGFKFSGYVIWRKNSFVVGRADYQSQHEPVIYGWKPGAKHRWFGNRKQTSVAEFHAADGGVFTQMPDGRWQVRIGDRILLISGEAKVEELAPSVMSEDRPKASQEHPTMKPVALIERMLKNSARAGELVLDPFGGSERLGMTAALVELEPRFCDVIVNRWQQFAGKTATLQRAVAKDDGAATSGAPVKGADDAGSKAQAHIPKARDRKPRKARAKPAGAKAGGGAALGAGAPVGRGESGVGAAGK